MSDQKVAAPESPMAVGRSRGRPRKVIDYGEVIDAVEKLFREGGLEAVSIERVAAEVGLSRATLYRAIPSKEHLLALLFRRMTDQLTEDALAAIADPSLSAREHLTGLLRVQIDAAVKMRDYMFVFLGSGWLPQEAYEHWRRWTRDYEGIWVGVLRAAAEEGTIATTDPVVAMRLVLGLSIWVSQWYSPHQNLTPDQIADEAVRLLRLEPNP